MERATEITIVAERLIEDGIIRIIEAAGATGYTVLEGSGKGRHGLHTRERPSVPSGAFDIVKIEVIVASREKAERIAQEVLDTYFTDYAGIVYLEDVEVFRPTKF